MLLNFCCQKKGLPDFGQPLYMYFYLIHISARKESDRNYRSGATKNYACVVSYRLQSYAFFLNLQQF